MRPALVALALLLPAPALAAELPVTVADFDYVDTSGEPADQSAAHAERIAAFADILRDGLDAEPAYEVRPLSCQSPPCTPMTMPQAAFVKAARESGARLVVYGGVHKMSTLVQTGKVHVLDLEAERLVVDRSFTFRGDTDEAFRRAASFIVGQIKDAKPAE